MKKQAKEKCDYHIMKFVICSGIPPTVVNSNEWKETINVLHPFYQSLSSSTLSSTLIVNEAAKISVAIDKYLSSSRNLTITFDGGKIRKPKSLYCVHVSTSDRHAFCMELDDAACLRHTAQYILEVLEQVSGNLAIEFLINLVNFSHIVEYTGHYEGWSMELLCSII